MMSRFSLLIEMEVDKNRNQITDGCIYTDYSILMFSILKFYVNHEKKKSYSRFLKWRTRTTRDSPLANLINCPVESAIWI